MSAPNDHSGKPPGAPPGVPRISPLGSEAAAQQPVGAPAAVMPPKVTAAAPKITVPGSSAPPRVPGAGPHPPGIAPAIPRLQGAPATVRPPPVAGAATLAPTARSIPALARAPAARTSGPLPPHQPAYSSRPQVPSVAPAMPGYPPVAPGRGEAGAPPVVLQPERGVPSRPAVPPSLPGALVPPGIAASLAKTQPGGPAVAARGVGPLPAVAPTLVRASGVMSAPVLSAVATSGPPGVARPPGAPGVIARPQGAPGSVPIPAAAQVTYRPYTPSPSQLLRDQIPLPPVEDVEFDFTPAQAITQPTAAKVTASTISAEPTTAGAPARPIQAIRKSVIPETGAVEQISPAQAADLKTLADALGNSDYFQTLQISQTASVGEIKRAFYRESRIYHPDRVFHLSDAETKQTLGDLYKRITEAYYVLRDDAKRKKYLAGITGPDRANKLRFSEASEVEQKQEVVKAREEEFGTNPKARQFFKTALGDIERQNWQSAERNIKMALTFEPSNAKFKEKMAEVNAKLEEHRKASHTGFMIK